MGREVMIDDFSIATKEFEIMDSENVKIKVIFDVTHEMYHDVTILLYENNFFVRVQKKHSPFKRQFLNILLRLRIFIKQEQ